MTKFTIQDYRNASALELVAYIRQGRTTKKELIDYAYQVIEETDPELNNIVAVLDKDVALSQAEALEDEGQLFYGVPLLIKGLGHQLEGANNSSGIEFLGDQSFDFTDEFVQAMIDAGFIIIGQTTYPQLGWLNVTNSNLFGPTHNPWDLSRNPGGSSGGSSAAVVTGQVPLATTSDAGGSTRIPASWSGLIGLHPSRNILISKEPISDRNQTSHFGIMKTMSDLKALFNILLRDEVSLPRHIFDNEVKIAYTTQTPAGTPLDPEAAQAVQDTVAFLEEQGFELTEVDYPADGKAMMMAYYTLASSYAVPLNDVAQTLLGRDLAPEDVELLTWGLYQAGQSLTDADLDQAWAVLKQMEEDLHYFYQDYDLLITPTTATSAPEADYYHMGAEFQPLMRDMSALDKDTRVQLIYDQWLSAWTNTPYTQLGNLTGTPSISLPLHLTTDGLPIGVLFSANFGMDHLLLEVGTYFERQDKFHILKNQ